MTVNGIECAFIGRLGGEPEMKTSQAGKPWSAISVAVGDGDEAKWVRVVAFGVQDPRPLAAPWVWLACSSRSRRGDRCAMPRLSALPGLFRPCSSTCRAESCPRSRRGHPCENGQRSARPCRGRRAGTRTWADTSRAFPAATGSTRPASSCTARSTSMPLLAFGKGPQRKCASNQGEERANEPKEEGRPSAASGRRELWRRQCAARASHASRDAPTTQSPWEKRCANAGVGNDADSGLRTPTYAGPEPGRGLGRRPWTSSQRSLRPRTDDRLHGVGGPNPRH
jgi:hypothetical protein